MADKMCEEQLAFQLTKLIFSQLEMRSSVGNKGPILLLSQVIDFVKIIRNKLFVVTVF